MADPYEALIKGVQQYGLSQAQQSPYAHLPNIGKGMGQMQFSNPWTTALANVGGNFLGGVGQQAQSSIANQAMADAYASLPLELGGQGAQQPEGFSPFMSAFRLAQLGEDRKDKREMAKYQGQLFDKIKSEALVKHQEYMNSPQSLNRPSPYLPLLGLGGGLPTGAPSLPMGGQPPSLAQAEEAIGVPEDVGGLLKRLEGTEEPTTPDYEDLLEKYKFREIADKEYSRQKGDIDTSRKLERDLRNDFVSKYEEVSSFPEIETHTANVVQALQDNSPQSDKIAAISFVKLLDPTGTAQLGETKAMEKAQSILQSVFGMANREIFQGSGFSLKARVNMAKLAKRTYQEKAKAYDSRYSQFSELEKRMELQEGSVTGGPRKPLFKEKSDLTSYSLDQLKQMEQQLLKGGN